MKVVTHDDEMRYIVKGTEEDLLAAIKVHIQDTKKVSVEIINLKGTTHFIVGVMKNDKPEVKEPYM